MSNFLSRLYPKKRWLRFVLMGVPIMVIIAITSNVVINNPMGIGYEPAMAVDPPPPDLPQEPEPEPESYIPYVPIPEPHEPVDMRPRAMLTGLPIDEEYLNRRPIAVVINNLHQALPQSGITNADIIYEVLTEGDVTRLVGIFQSYLPEKIGPVRSARDSFIDFAFNHDALFIHHGRSPDADTRIRNTGITILDGMALEGTVFWRDRDYPYWHSNTGRRPLEHSSYTSRQRLIDHINGRSIRFYVNESPYYGLNFGEVPEEPDAGVAHTVRIPFSVPYVRRFIFDQETGLYLVENRDGPTQDAETQEQAAVANILIQITTKRVTGTLGQRTVGTVGTGYGYFVTGGYYRPVRWAKDSHTQPMRWYFDDGTPLVLAPGVTWICVFQNTGTVEFGA